MITIDLSQLPELYMVGAALHQPDPKTGGPGLSLNIMHMAWGPGLGWMAQVSVRGATDWDLAKRRFETQADAVAAGIEAARKLGWEGKLL